MYMDISVENGVLSSRRLKKGKKWWQNNPISHNGQEIWNLWAEWNKEVQMQKEQ